MNVTITITGDLNDAALILQSLANCTPSPRTVDAASFVPKVKAAAVKALAEAEPVDQEVSFRPLGADQPDNADLAEASAGVLDAIPAAVKAPKPPRTKVKPVTEKADKAVVGTIPTPVKAPTRDEAKLAMEKFVGKHGTVGLVTKLGALGARRLSEVPDDKLGEFVAALDA